MNAFASAFVTHASIHLFRLINGQDSLHGRSTQSRIKQRMAWLILLAIGAGALNPLQGTNAELYKHWQQPLWTASWVYLSGLTVTMLLQAFARQPLPTAAAVHSAPWWAYVGGTISVATTLIGLMFAQKLGAGLFTGLSITASVVVSILLDHMGWIGFKQHPASPLRITGGALMIVGIWLVSKF